MDTITDRHEHLRDEHRRLREATQELVFTADLLLHIQRHGRYPDDPQPLSIDERAAALAKLQRDLAGHSTTARALTTR